MIQFSLASKITMSCAHDHYNGPVLGVNIYTDQNCKDNALPVQLNSTFDQTCNLCATFKEIVLPAYSEKQFSKIDQRLTILAPFTVSPNVSSKKLKQLCNKWKKTLYNAYPETMHKDIVNVLSLFILNRFRDLSVKEVKEMLNFDLSSTRAGIELIGIGEKRGKKEGQRHFLIMTLKDRFGKLSKQFEIDQRLTILAPFTVSPDVSSKKLKQLFYKWKKTLFNAYPETLHKDIVNVLLFILKRIRDLSVKELKKMLNFDLSATIAGIELFGMGERKGQKNFLIMALKDRFGKLSKQFEIEIRKTNFTTLVKLRKFLFNFSSIDDLD